MDFWTIIIVLVIFCGIGGSCSLVGTWWDKNRKKQSEDK